MNPKCYQNEIWSNTSVLYDTFLTCFWLNGGDWKLVPGRETQPQPSKLLKLLILTSQIW